jgi:Flp pilus assembly protein TadD
MLGIFGLKPPHDAFPAARSHFLLGRSYAMVGEFQLAIEALSEAVRIAGSVPRFEGSLGYAYARAGRRADAEAILDRFSRGPLAPVISPLSAE